MQERIKKAFNQDNIQAYTDLDAYLNKKELSLKTYFDKPLVEKPFQKMYNKVMETKAGRFFLKRTIDWIREKLPGFIVGGILTVAGTVWGILQVAQDMGKAVISKRKNAVKNLGDKLKEIAKKQNAPIRALLTGLGRILSLGAAGLSFIKDHFWYVVITLTIIMILGIIALVIRNRRRARVRIREDDD